MAYDVTTVPTQVPKRWVIGDTIRWMIQDAEHAVGTWTYTFRFANAAGAFSKSGVDDGDGNHLFKFTPAQSASLAAGKFHWQLQLTDGSDVFTVARSSEAIEVVASMSAATDARSEAETNVEAIRAMIAGKQDVASYEIAGRALSRFSWDELQQALTFWEQRLEDIQDDIDNENGRAPKVRRSLVRFV